MCYNSGDKNRGFGEKSNMTTHSQIISQPPSVPDNLQHRASAFAADPAVQEAIAQLTAAVEQAEDDLATRTSIAARLVCKLHACYIPGTGPSEDYGTARAELFAHAKDFREADAIPGIFAYPATLLTFADDSQAFIPSNDSSRDAALPVLLEKPCIFVPDDLLGDRIPRVYANRRELTAHTKPVILKYHAQSRSARTKRTYAAQWQQWADFAAEHNMKVLPADPSDVAQWLIARAQSSYSFSTINIGLQAVKAIHLHYDQPHPCDPLVQKTFSGIRKRLGVAQAQVDGLTPDAIRAIEATACTPRRTRGGKTERAASARKRGHIDIAIVKVSFEALLRLQELASLRWENVEVDPDDGSGVLHIESSKTDRAGEGARAYISADTVTALERIRGAAGQNDRIFQLCKRQLRRRITAAAAAAGLEGQFSGHSGRVGMAQVLAASNAELPQIQAAGRWKSTDMPATYARFLTPKQGAVAQLDRQSRETST